MPQQDIPTVVAGQVEGERVEREAEERDDQAPAPAKQGGTERDRQRAEWPGGRSQPGGERTDSRRIEQGAARHTGESWARYPSAAHDPLRLSAASGSRTE